MNKDLLYVYLLLIAVLFNGCKSSSGLPEIKASSGTIATEHSLRPEEAVKLIQQNQPAFRTAKVKRMGIKADLKNRQLDMKASCNIVSDSAIHLSIQPFFGVELFKLELTPTSLILIDKPNKRYYESSYASIKKQFGITLSYDAIQSLISNRLFVAGKKIYLPTDFEWKSHVPSDTLFVQFDSMWQETILHLTSGRITGVILQTNDNNYSLKVGYSNCIDFKKTLFPSNISFDIFNGYKSKASFYFTIEDVDFDIPLSPEPINLSRYSRGDINSLFNK